MPHLKCLLCYVMLRVLLFSKLASQWHLLTPLLLLLQTVAGMFFFWSFMVLVFMILLNFLLAIIVDAFSEVKERTKETTGKQDGCRAVNLAMLQPSAMGSFPSLC